MKESESTPPFSTFVGRAGELQSLREALEAGARLLSVVGPPGVGKTRLVQQFTSLLDSEFRSAFVDLVSVRSRPGLLAAVAEALGFRDYSPVDDAAFTAQLRRAIDDCGPTLLVLDNFEQLLESAPLLSEWLAAAPDLTLLVTTRQWLQVEGERRFELAPLTSPAPGEGLDGVLACDAVRLLLDRVGLMPEGKDLLIVADAARRLEGLPLAIELYAARAAVHGFASFDDAAFRTLLSRPANGLAGDRHATLAATFEWSWSLLSSEEQGALAGISVFRGGFDLDAAANVLAPVTGQLDKTAAIVHALRKNSLLASSPGQTGRPRYRLLEAVRQFAEEKLNASPDANAVRRRHASYYLGRIAELSPLANGERAPEFRALLVKDTPNALAAATALISDGQGEDACRLLVALFPVLGRGGRSFEYRAKLAELLDVLPSDAAQRALVHATSATQFLLAGDRMRGVVELEKARDEGARLERPDLSDEAKAKLALLDPQQALPTDEPAKRAQLARLDELVERTTARGSVLGQICVHVSRVFHLAGYPGKSIQLLERSSRAFLEERNEVDGATVKLHLASMFVANGRFEEALNLCREVIRLADSIGDTELLRRALPCLARAELARGNCDAALTAAERGITLQQFLGDRWSEGYGLAGLADIMLFEGRWRDAIRVYQEAIERLIEHGEMALAGVSLARTAVAQASLRDLPLAAETFARGKSLITRAERPDLLAAAELSFGHLLLENGDRGGAEKRLEIAASLNAEGAPIGETRDEVRYAVRLLLRALAQHGAPEVGKEFVPDWTVAPDGSWFERRSDERIFLAKRPSERRVLVHLIEQHLAAPGRAVSREELFRAGWPGESIQEKAAKNRVNVALAHLRESGLRAILTTRSDGVLVDPAARVGWGTE